MSTSPKTRQITSIPLLHRLTQATLSEFDNVTASIDNELTPLYELTTSGTSLVLNIGPSAFENTVTSLNRDTPPIGSAGINFSSGTVTFPSASGGSATPSGGGAAITITIASGNYLKVGIHISSAGLIVLNTGTQNTTQATATIPGYVSGCIAVGYVILQNVGGTIQNLTNASIYQYQTVRSFVDGLPAMSNGQLWIGSTGQLPSAATLSQGAFQSVTISNGAGSITLDTVQDIRTSATPTFAGINITGPTALTGALQLRYGTVRTSAYTITTSDCIVPVNTTGGAVTVTLPASVAGNKGQLVIVVDVGYSINQASKAITITPNGTDTIQGANASTLLNYAPGSALSLVSNGAGGWNII